MEPQAIRMQHLPDGPFLTNHFQITMATWVLRIRTSRQVKLLLLGGLKEAAQDVDIHMEVTEQAVEGMAKGSGAVVFEEEVADPGRSIAEQG